MAINPQVLQNCLPALVTAEQKLSQLAASKGIRYRIASFGGVRSQSDTTKILGYRDEDYKVYLRNLPVGQTPIPKDKWRPIASYGHSFHNYGAAFDIQITTPAPGTSVAQSLNLVGSYARQAGLRWGADFGDDPHFELPLPIGTVKSAWEDLQSNHPQGMSTLGVVGGLAIIGLLLLGLRKWF